MQSEYVIYLKRITDSWTYAKARTSCSRMSSERQCSRQRWMLGLPNDMVFIPMGPWANILVGKDTGGCGTPQFKGLEVDVAATDSPVLDIRDLFKPLRRAKA